MIRRFVLFTFLRSVCLLVALVVSGSAAAHSGHGLTSIGHALEHGALNFVVIVVLAAALLLWQRGQQKP